MKRIFMTLLCISLFTVIANPLNAANKISAEKKAQMLTIETRIVELLRERHKLAGEAVDIRGYILEAKKRATPETEAEMTKKIKNLNVQLYKKNVEIKGKNALIKTETAKLKKLMPKKKTVKKRRRRTTKKPRKTTKKNTK